MINCHLVEIPLEISSRPRAGMTSWLCTDTDIYNIESGVTVLWSSLNSGVGVVCNLSVPCLSSPCRKALILLSERTSLGIFRCSTGPNLTCSPHHALLVHHLNFCRALQSVFLAECSLLYSFVMAVSDDPAITGDLRGMSSLAVRSTECSSKDQTSQNSRYSLTTLVKTPEHPAKVS